MRSRAVWLAAAMAAGLVAGACAARRPVLYPNSQLQRVGAEEAEAQIDRCLERATAYGADESRVRRVAESGAKSSTVGAVTGAAVGAVVGSAGRGAAAGAAGGAAGGVVRGVFQTQDPDPVFQRFVERCLRDAGFEPIGWR